MPIYEKNAAKILTFHQSMLADKARTESYRRAIHATVKPGDVVLDVGTGTGILAFFACQAGARRVYAIDGGNVIELARLLARQNGLDGRIEFLNDWSSRVVLPEPVDVIVTETMGNFGLEEGILETVIDARTRFLKKDGTIIPQAVELFVAPIEQAGVYQQVDTWANDLYGVDYTPLRRFAANNFYRTKLEEPSFLSAPAALARIQLMDVATAEFHGRAGVTVRRGGTLHGIGGWFSAQLAAGVALTNAVPLQTPSWNHIFFPLAEPLAVDPGDALTIQVDSFNGGEWRWQVERQTTRSAPAGQAHFEHSTFLGFPMSKDRLEKLSSRFAPRLSRAGEAEQFVLALFDGGHALEEIELDLRRCFPDEFKTRQDSGAFVREIVARCA